MLEELLPYYERELANLRQLSGEFARRYPKIAGRLMLEGDQCEDPHVERLLEGFAFMASRIHRKLDDEYPEITESLLQVLYPHYTQPLPSCTMLQLETDPAKPEITGRYRINRHQMVLAPAVQGVQCKFRTAYDVDLWPITVKDARIELVSGSPHLQRAAPDAAAVLTLKLVTQGNLPIAQLGLDRLRFFLDGDPQLMPLLYELLCVRTMRVQISDGQDTPAHTVRLPASSISPVGFGRDEGLFDYDARAFLGYRLLSEYFAFPEKFLFVELGGLDHAALQHTGQSLEIRILFDRYRDSERYLRLIDELTPAQFRLGCTPAINLFRQAAEPIRITHLRDAYPVWPDSRKQHAFEVIHMDNVVRVERAGSDERTQQVPPFYSVNHAASSGSRFYWHTTREQSTRPNDRGTDVMLSLVEIDFSAARPDAEVLSIEATCSNRDLPEQIPFGGGAAGSHTDFSLPGNAIVKRARALRKPTPTLRAPAKRGLQWRLISHLSLNYLSIVEGGREALQEMLTLYNFSDSQANARQIQGIVSIQSRAAVTRVNSGAFSGFVRGTEIDLTLDDEFFVGTGIYLFASVLERFFALYCTPNSFVRLRLKSRHQTEEVALWKPRSGEAIVI